MRERSVGRRECLKTLAGATASMTAASVLRVPAMAAFLSATGASGGCSGTATMPPPGRDGGRLQAQPGVPTRAATTGLQPLGLGGTRDGLCFIPTTYTPSVPLPLVVMFHGAGGSANGALQPFLPLAESAKVVLLAVESRRSTWDRVLGGFGEDANFLNSALTDLYERCAIDPARRATAGFSDGASYSLSLGLTNGDMFRQLVAFSPGFSDPASLAGTPRVFVSHGTSDGILPIDATSRRIVPSLRSQGYNVTYREFAGTHQVPTSVAAEAMSWLQAGWG